MHSEWVFKRLLYWQCIKLTSRSKNLNRGSFKLSAVLLSIARLCNGNKIRNIMHYLAELMRWTSGKMESQSCAVLSRFSIQVGLTSPLADLSLLHDKGTTTLLNYKKQLTGITTRRTQIHLLVSCSLWIQEFIIVTEHLHPQQLCDYSRTYIATLKVTVDVDVKNVKAKQQQQRLHQNNIPHFPIHGMYSMKIPNNAGMIRDCRQNW